MNEMTSPIKVSLGGRYAPLATLVQKTVQILGDWRAVYPFLFIRRLDDYNLGRECPNEQLAQSAAIHVAIRLMKDDLPQERTIFMAMGKNIQEPPVDLS